MTVSSQPESFGGDCYFKLAHNNSSVYSAFTYSNGILDFENDKVQPISISAISEVIREADNTLYLKGTFYQDNQIVNQVEIFFYRSELREKLIKVIHKTVEVAKAKFILTNNESYKEFVVEVKKKNDKISITDTSTQKTFVILEITDKLIVSDHVLLFFNQQGYAFFLIFEGKIPLDLSQFNLIENAYYHKCCILNGSLNQEYFDGKEVSLMLDEELIYIFADYHKNFSFAYNQLKLCQVHSNGTITYQFIASTREVSYITFSRNLDALRSLESAKSFADGQLVFIDEDPFLLSFANGAWSFYQSKDRNSSILLDQLINIEVNENSDPERIKVSFQFDQEPGNKSFFVHESFLPQLYERTFRGKKASIVKKASVTDLYTSLNRQINDFLIYNLFGQLMLLQTGIEEIQKKKGVSGSQKNKQILNFMYHAIKEQRRILDRVALQFPEMLLAEEQRFIPYSNDQPFEVLQTQLLAMSGQIQRHLLEIENSLNHLSFAIIPKKTIRKAQTDKTTNLKYMGAAAIAGLGLATGGVGILVGGLMGLNTYLSSNERDVRQQYTEENENYKIEFYINRALDSFEHLLDNMLPYYISQVSKAYFNLTKKQCLQLLKLSEEEVTRCKNLIFSRLAELYMVKQLPMEQGNLLTRENIIELLMTSTEADKRKLIGSLTE